MAEGARRMEKVQRAWGRILAHFDGDGTPWPVKHGRWLPQSPRKSMLAKQLDRNGRSYVALAKAEVLLQALRPTGACWPANRRSNPIRVRPLPHVACHCVRNAHLLDGW